MFPEKAQLTIIGGGSAGLALAYHLAQYNLSDVQITILESRKTYKNDRTWCFWDFDELHAKLRPIIRHRWKSWSFSAKNKKIVHRSTSHPYCAVSAGDFYHAVTSHISEMKNITLVNDCRVDVVVRRKGGFVLSTSKGEMLSEFVVDTRPPIADYHLRGSSSHIPVPQENFPGSPMYQIFFGYEIELENAILDSSTAQLMHNMTGDGSGLEFVYILPYSKKQALVEYTTFTPAFFPAEQLREKCIAAIKNLVGSKKCKVVHQEGAVLPMGFSGLEATQKNLLHAGIIGGSIRDSTGYAFIRTQRWAERCAAEIVTGKMPTRMDCDRRVDIAMDKVFLKVLRHDPHISPTLFMGMARYLSADAFARFMMEKSTWHDYLRVISSMPAKPFLQQVFSKST